MSFKGKVVLITGGSSGIGAETAVLFAKEGAIVTIVGRNQNRLEAVAEKCKKYTAMTLTIKADLAKDEEVDSIVNTTFANFGKLDVLVNCAAILKDANIMEEKYFDVFDEIIKVNFRAVVRLTKHAVPYLVMTKGTIINVTGVASVTCGRPNFSAFRTSKAALMHFTRCLASELAGYGVRVNGVSPGPVKTNHYNNVTVSAEIVKDSTALNKVSDPEEIAEMILYLASNKGRSITGVNYEIDNGRLLGTM